MCSYIQGLIKGGRGWGDIVRSLPFFTIPICAVMFRRVGGLIKGGREGGGGVILSGVYLKTVFDFPGDFGPTFAGCRSHLFTTEFPASTLPERQRAKSFCAR